MLPKGTIIHKVLGMSEDSSVVTFITSAGVFEMLHHQDCCEHVYLADVNGDEKDLEEATVVHFEERTQDGAKASHDSITWTFYDIQTNKGCVNLRWIGESNGYYSEGVSFDRLTTKKALMHVPNSVPVRVWMTETGYVYIYQSNHPKFSQYSKVNMDDYGLTIIAEV